MCALKPTCTHIPFYLVVIDDFKLKQICVLHFTIHEDLDYLIFYILVNQFTLHFRNIMDVSDWLFYEIQNHTSGTHKHQCVSDK